MVGSEKQGQGISISEKEAKRGKCDEPCRGAEYAAKKEQRARKIK